MSSKLFEIPELVQQVFALLTVSDCARLANTSQVIFGATVPRIWNEVCGVDKLLRLIPETLFQDESPNKGTFFVSIS